MNWESFKPFFHESWHSKMRNFVESEECDKIYAFLKKETKRGNKLAPLSSNVFRCFLETPLDDLMLILCGMSPYHIFRNNLPVADGLLFGCSITNYPQPSLDQWYTCLENELYEGLNLHYTRNPDVSYLAHQGVLMLNASLTCEMNKAGSHNLIWEPFMKYLFENVLDTTGVPIVLLGKEAAKMEKYIMPFTWIFRISHPASASYQGIEWSSEGMFKSINKILKERNNYEIDWLNLNPF